MSMRGGVIQRGGTWSYVVRVPDPITGKVRVKWHGGYPTEKAAKAARDKARVAVAEGTHVDRTTITVSDYLAGWLPGHVAALKPKSASGYRHVLDLYVLPRIGAHKLQQVKPSTISKLYADLQATGSRSGGPLSARTVHGVHRVLRRAFQDAVNDDLIVRNPVDRARAPRVTQVEHTDPWHPTELAAFLTAAAGHRLGTFYRVSAYTGARRGEVLALLWDDLSLDEGTVTISKSTAVVDGVHVVGTPKGGRSRTIGIDAETVTALREHQGRQDAEREHAGSGWSEHGLVFTQANGEPLSPDTVSQLMPKLCALAGVRPIRLHDLRHLHATWLLTAGQPVHEVARRLGHRDAVITLTTYAHIVSGRDAVLADVFAEAARSISRSNEAPTLRAI